MCIVECPLTFSPAHKKKNQTRQAALSIHPESRAIFATSTPWPPRQECCLSCKSTLVTGKRTPVIDRVLTQQHTLHRQLSSCNPCNAKCPQRCVERSLTESQRIVENLQKLFGTSNLLLPQNALRRRVQELAKFVRRWWPEGAILTPPWHRRCSQESQNVLQVLRFQLAIYFT
jgi:hypothetical protein